MRCFCFFHFERIENVVFISSFIFQKKRSCCHLQWPASAMALIARENNWKIYLLCIFLLSNFQCFQLMWKLWVTTHPHPCVWKPSYKTGFESLLINQNTNKSLLILHSFWQPTVKLRQMLFGGVCLLVT